MKKYEFVFEKEELLNSEAFKNDDITKAINALNGTLGYMKCRGIKLELTDFKDTESLIDLNGFIVRGFTVAKLITAGIVKIRESEIEFDFQVSSIFTDEITENSTLILEAPHLMSEKQHKALENSYSKKFGCTVVVVAALKLKGILQK